MNIVNNRYLKHGLMLLIVNCSFGAQSINATEWQKDSKLKLGFSDFTPPSASGVAKYKNNFENGRWSSGSSFNEENKVRYSPVASKNPWKPVKSKRYKKTFSAQRPWGNVPDRKSKNKNNMKLYDQRFKQWSHQQNSSYLNNSYGQSALPFSGAYGYPELAYNSPRITPWGRPGINVNSARYGLYPGAAYPSAGLFSRPGFW